MRTNKRVDEEIQAAADFVNSFQTYDPANQSQATGFAVLEALEWARGRHVDSPSSRRIKIAARSLAWDKLAERKA